MGIPTERQLDKKGVTYCATCDASFFRDKVVVVARLSGLAPGNHGFHIHENGDCSAPDASSAGASFDRVASFAAGGGSGAGSGAGSAGSMDWPVHNRASSQAVSSALLSLRKGCSGRPRNFSMAASVASPLERQFTTIAGIDEMTSRSGTGSMWRSPISRASPVR